MKKPHLFFIKLFTKWNVYYYTMKYDLEKVQSTTNTNIITIVRDLLKSDRQFYDSIDKQMQFNIKEAQLKEEYNVGDLHRFLSHYIYYDYKINEWVITHKNNPDYKILNCIREDASLKVMMIGSYFDNIVRNDKERENIFDLFERYYHIKPTDALIYTIPDESDKSSIEAIYDCLPNDRNKNYALILQDGYTLSTIKKFTELCYNKPNIEVFVLSDFEYYSVYIDSAEIKFKKVCLR